MLFDGKPLETVTEADLQRLVDTKFVERKSIDYKASLSESTDGQKAEFLNDVSSFANAQGGHLVCGIKEEAGVPIEVCGLDIADTDALKLKLESIIRSGVRPRISGVSTWAIRLQNGRAVVIISISKSWNSPNMVTFNDQYRFYGRGTNGKYRLDVDELRNVFVRSATVADRIRSFRLERIAKILEGEEPVPLIKENGRAVLHIVPFGAFETGLRLRLEFPSDAKLYWPMNCVNHATDYIPRINFDGFLMHALTGIGVDLDRKSRPFSYVQFFTNGIIEATDSLLVERQIAEKQWSGKIRGDTLVPEMLDGLGRYLSVQKTLGVEPPLCVMVTLIGVSGSRLFANGVYSGWLVDREVLQIPEIVLESFDCEPAMVMRPIFDAIWNAAGYARSLNYDKQGKWVQ